MAKTTTTATIDTAAILRAYNEQPLTLSRLPYTAEFEGIVKAAKLSPASKQQCRSVLNTLVELNQNKRLQPKARGRKTTVAAAK